MLRLLNDNPVSSFNKQWFSNSDYSIRSVTSHFITNNILTWIHSSWFIMSVYGGGRIETPGTCAFNICSIYLYLLQIFLAQDHSEIHAINATDRQICDLIQDYFVVHFRVCVWVCGWMSVSISYTSRVVIPPYLKRVSKSIFQHEGWDQVVLQTLRV